MLEPFRQYIRSRQLIQPGDQTLIAVSGGIDSMTLLDLMRQTYPDHIAAAHCNFSLRGEESDNDQQHVEDYCHQHTIPLHTIRFDTESESHAHGESIQMAARRLRYQWFEQLSTQHNYTKIAIAHHADDSAETFFINLLRGTGLRGLTGISDQRGPIIRPLLFARRDDITAYATSHSVPYREDSTNATLKYLRNRLRHDIIPRLDSASGNRLSRTMEENLMRLSQTQQYIDRQIRKLRSQALHDNVIDLAALDSECLGFELYELLQPYEFAAETIESMARVLLSHAEDSDITSSGKRFDASAWSATIDRRRILLTPRTIEPFREEWIAEDDPRVQWLTVSELPDSLATPPDTAYITADALRFPLHLRQWQEGDWFIPLGMAGQKKVSDYLIDAKVPVTEKSRQGVLLSCETIVWLAGRRIDDRYKVRQDARRIIRITL